MVRYQDAGLNSFAVYVYTKYGSVVMSVVDADLPVRDLFSILGLEQTVDEKTCRSLVVESVTSMKSSCTTYE